jgi:hypothetical protein
MMRRLLGLACVLLLAGCGEAEPPAAAGLSAATPAIPPATPVPAATAAAANTVGEMARYDGYGDLRFGMDQAAFDRAWGGELKGTPQPGSSCFYKTPKWVRTTSDFAFMFEGGRFVRYDVGTAKETAPGGGKVGMSVALIRALYGTGVQAQPHKYVPGTHTLRIPAPQGSGVLLFETDAQGTVTRWRVGVPPQVDYVEGCA